MLSISSLSSLAQLTEGNGFVSFEMMANNETKGGYNPRIKISLECTGINAFAVQPSYIIGRVSINGNLFKREILFHIRSFLYEWTSVSGAVGNGGPRIVNIHFHQTK